METEFGGIALDFLTVVLCAFLAVVASTKLKQPPVVFLIFAGALIGPNAIGILHNSEVINTFAEIGAVLLLFYVGLEFDFAKLMRVSVRAAAFAAAKISVIFIAVYEVALLMGIDQLTAAVAGLMLAITSTAIFVQLVPRKDKLGKEPKFLVAELIVEDLAVIIGIAAISSINSPGFTIHAALASIATGIAALGLAYFVVRRGLEWLSEKLDLFADTQTTLFFALTLCIAMSFLAIILGLSSAIGAFLAGSLIASLKGGGKAHTATEPLGLAFSAVFFISIGMLTNPGVIAAGIGVFAAILAAQLASSYAGTFFASRMVGFNARKAAFAAGGFLAIGEFSLLLAREAAPFASIDLVGLASLGVLISTPIASKAVANHEKAAETVERHLPKSISQVLQRWFGYTARVLGDLEYGSPMHEAVVREFDGLRGDAKRIVGAGLAVFIVNIFLRGVVIDAFGLRVSLFAMAVALLAIVALMAIMRTLIALLRILSRLEGTIVTKREQSRLKQAWTSALGALACAILVMLTPIGISALRLPALFRAIEYVFIVIGIVLAWSAIKTAASVRMKK